MTRSSDPPEAASAHDELRTAVEALPSAVPGTRERARLKGCLIVTEGPQAGQRFPFKDSVLLGRERGVDVLLDYRSVSRRHARISRLSNGEFQIEDFSQNGTWVNQTQVTSAVLRIGDVIRLGSRVFLRFTLLDPADDRLQQAQKMEAIGRLTAGITHDINNLLTALLMSSAWLREMRGDTTLEHEEVQECLQDIETATNRAAELTARLGTFTRNDGSDRKPVDFSELCEEVLQLVRRMIPQSIHLERSIEPDLVVEGSRSLLHQMLINPCINARDAMPNGGTLTVRVELDRSGTTVATRPLVVISFEDTGTGMDEGTRAAVFEPFFTTKAEGRGTGLGLATVQKVVEDHGGRIELSSQVGHGTTLQVFLPSARSLLRIAERTVSGEIRDSVTLRPDAERAQGQAILIVDDDDLVVRSLSGVLDRLGYQTRSARDGIDAVRVYQEAPRPELVLLDLDLPRADGVSCYREIKRLDPNARIVFVSGAPESVEARAIQDRDGIVVLRKPVELRRLRETVAQTLKSFRRA